MTTARYESNSSFILHNSSLYSGPWSNGRTPARQAGNPGSIPGGSTDIRKVAGYGLPGRFAEPCDLRVMWVRIPCLPLCPDGEMDNHVSLLTRCSGFESWSGCWEMINGK